jgi:hypothetical protein
MQKIPAAILWTILLMPMASTRAEPVGQADAVIQLLNLFASRADPLGSANAGGLVNKGISPAEVVATDLHKSLDFMGGWNSPETTRSLAKRLGNFVANHSAQFPAGLPDPGAVKIPLRLGPFFEGLFPLGPRTSELFQKELTNLQPLLDDSWLEAAAGCGAIHFQQLVLAHRGRIDELLLTYQKSENDLALICLGEALANYSDALRKIEPGKFSTRALAHLLSGAMGMENPDPKERRMLIEIAAGWTKGHPDLIVMLRDLRDPSSLGPLEIRIKQPSE